MAKKSELKVEERVEAVLVLLRREEPAAVLARHYQVSGVTLYRWRDVFLEGGKAGLGKPEGSAESAAARRIEQLEGELAQRAQVIGELTIGSPLWSAVFELFPSTDGLAPAARAGAASVGSTAVGGRVGLRPAVPVVGVQAVGCRAPAGQRGGDESVRVPGIEGGGPAGEEASP